MKLERLEAKIISKSKIMRKGRFKPDPHGEKSYHGELYDYEGTQFNIEFVNQKTRQKYSTIKNLIIGLGQKISLHTDVPEGWLERQYHLKAANLEKVIEKINVGEIVAIIISKDLFSKNRTDAARLKEEYQIPIIIKFRYDPCLWQNDCLLYAPFGYESLDYGDGRRTAMPEVKAVQLISRSK